MEEVWLKFPGTFNYLHLATTMSREICAQFKEIGVDDDFAQDVELCVSEACTNAIKYGCRENSNDMVTLCFQVFPDKILVNIGDKGKGFNLKDIPSTLPDSLSESGRGLFIIRAKMDEVQYVREKERNFLAMTKYFRGSK